MSVILLHHRCAHFELRLIGQKLDLTFGDGEVLVRIGERGRNLRIGEVKMMARQVLQIQLIVKEGGGIRAWIRHMSPCHRAPTHTSAYQLWAIARFSLRFA